MRWSRIADAESFWVYGVAIAALVAMRFAVVALMPGLELHFLGVAIAVLMFGWSFGIYALAIATLATYALGGNVWVGLAWEFVLGAACPAAAVWLLYSATRVFLPRNPFIYFLVVAFGGGMLSLLVAQLGKASFLWLTDAFATKGAFESFVLTLPAMMFAEGFLAGGALTIFAMYRPRWVATFDDDFYLRRE